ncbi:hypothetical protein Rhe02_51660 [Rhizocola hellebori]|uniref:Uncharacterized protein n=2 Tax=Rhizocola hellebori TaxID=1392758 RepID=A0A8J3QBW8_9ACTN|nr:hypothetical protein Rhe02_51660 [Rhizocola hellebori]
MLRAAVSVAAVAMCIAVVQAPAMAKTASGVDENFWAGCDASLYVSDSVIGSPGKIEAWGGWSCPSPAVWGGVLTIDLYRNGTKVASQAKNYDKFAATGHGEVTATNIAGSQNWYAKLWMSGAIYAEVRITTGTIAS